jgi:copper(I)-binding protein
MRALIAATLALLAASCGASQTSPNSAPTATALLVQGGWAAPTPGGVDVSAGYLTIVNHTAEGDQLLSAESSRARRVEVHEMTMHDGVMQMRAVRQLDVPAGAEIALSPNGRHLMFYGITEPFAEGQSIPVRLTFVHAGVVDVSLPVQRQGAQHGH